MHKRYNCHSLIIFSISWCGVANVPNDADFNEVMMKPYGLYDGHNDDEPNLPAQHGLLICPHLE